MKQTAVEKLIKGQQEIISNFKLNVEQQEKLTQLFDQCFELQKQQSLELIELTTQLTSVATANWKVAEIECINIYNHYYNDIIIPKEEPKLQCKDCNDSLTDCTCIEDTINMKQETLEEAAKNATKMYVNEREKQTVYLSFIEGAKWQQEIMYSEEEVRKITLDFFYHWWNSKGTNTEQGFDKWFEQIKKK